MTGAAQRAEQSYLNARNTLAVALVVALLVAVGAGMWLMRSINAPLNQALAVADRVSQGDLTSTIEIHAKDEIGKVLYALQRMQEYASLPMPQVSLLMVFHTLKAGPHPSMCR